MYAKHLDYDIFLRKKMPHKVDHISYIDIFKLPPYIFKKSLCITLVQYILNILTLLWIKYFTRVNLNHVRLLAPQCLL